MRGIKIVFALALVGACASWAFAEDLPVGLSDYPRIIRKDFPKIRPGRELRLGVFRFHPTFETSAEYDDNIRLSDSNEQEDVIFTQRPGILIDTRLGKHQLTAGYWAEIENLVDHREENAVNHIANGNLHLDLGKLSLNLTELMEDSTSRLFNEDSSRDSVFLNTAEGRARYVRGKWVLEGGYRNNRVDHKPPRTNPNDYLEHVYSVLLGHNVGAKTTLFVEGIGGIVRYDDNSINADHDYWQTFLGLTRKIFFEKVAEETQQVERSLNTRMQATARIGYQNRQLSDVPGRGPQEEFQGVVADASLFYRPNLFEPITLDYVRNVNVSTFQNNEWFRQDKVSFAWKKRLLKKLYIIPRASWTRLTYPEVSTVNGVADRRQDDFYQFQGELRYEPRIDEITGVAWVWASLIYTYRSRASNFDTFDFDNNKVALKVGFSY